MIRPNLLRRGLSLIEVLIGAMLLTGLFIPILHLSTRNVGETKRDSVRLVCETLCRTVLEAFGRVEFEALPLLEPTDEPGVYQAIDVWNRQDILKQLVYSEDLTPLLKAYQIRTILTVRKDVAPGLHQLTSTITWKETRGGNRKDRSIRYSRLYADPQPLPR